MKKQFFGIILICLIILSGCSPNMPAGPSQIVLQSEQPSFTVATATPEPTIDAYTTEPAESNAVESPGVYSYEIKTTVDELFTSTQNAVVEFKYSRPVFTETSELAKTVNMIYDQAEIAYKNKMNSLKTGFSDIPPDESGNSEFYTEICETTYEKNGIISFTSTEDWWIGGVQTRNITGHTFDFKLGRELKISDIIYGDETQITDTLINEFYNWLKQNENLDSAYIDDIDIDNMIKDDIKKQSGPDAKFYLTEEGLHIFYYYVLPAHQGGIDVLIPWTRTDILRPINK